MAIEVHFEKRIINNNVVREADTRSHRDYVIVTVLAGVFLLGLFAYAWQHYQFIQYGYRIESAQKKKETLLETRKRLHLERSSLSDLGRINSIAQGELGMTLPQPGQVVTISADSPLTIPGQAKPGQEPAEMAAKR